MFSSVGGIKSFRFCRVKNFSTAADGFVWLKREDARKLEFNKKIFFDCFKGKDYHHLFQVVKLIS